MSKKEKKLKKIFFVFIIQRQLNIPFQFEFKIIINIPIMKYVSSILELLEHVYDSIK